MFGPFDDELLSRTATSKGFNSVTAHMHHLMKQCPQWCGATYQQYEKISKCEGMLHKRRQRCERLRRFLVDDCGAVRNGYSLKFPDESHLEAKQFDKEQLLGVQAALRGMSAEEFRLLLDEEHKRTGRTKIDWELN